AVPYAEKNLKDVAGHTTLAWARLQRDRPQASHDASAVAKQAASGGLLSGMRKMDPYANGFTTENSQYRATRNPHDAARSAGGSSG
ncbi:amidase family protein, partial [Erwinia amylovora]|uniref:amidase family protein n=1 Tax=Erwinia amylovora TaxID=552 RepID=UPI0020C0E392